MWCCWWMPTCRFCSFYVFIVVTSYSLYLSESFTTSIPTPFITRSTRQHSPSLPVRNQQHYYYNSIHNGGIAILSSHQQHKTNDEAEKPEMKKKRRSWEESFQLLVSYKQKYGNCIVPRNYKEVSHLCRWVDVQRTRKDSLSEKKRAKLDAIGFSWANERNKERWEDMFTKLIKYKEQYGNCNVPTKYIEDPRLGLWVMTQRSKRASLSDERIVKLDAVGFLWTNEIYEEQWDKMFEKLKRYAEMNNGDCNVPGNHDDTANWSLWQWVTKQRKRKSLLSQDQHTKLDQLGLIWEDSAKDKADQKWNEKYELLKDYKQNHGHCKVPQRWKEDPSLGKWVSRQRQDYMNGLLPEDRRINLEEMDFTWKICNGHESNYFENDYRWFVKFGKLHNYLAQQGHCDVPLRYEKDRSLGSWVANQRNNERDGILNDDRKMLLDEIGFTWCFEDQREEQWREKYEELKHLKTTNGHERIPNTNSSLSTWVYRQRVMLATGKLKLERKALLDEIDFQ